VVTGGDGRGVPDALVEIWRAHADGIAQAKSGPLLRYPCIGGGRAVTDEQGRFSISMVPPRRPTPGAAPFVIVTTLVQARRNRLITRAYLPGCHLAEDPLLRSLPAERRRTLIATRDEVGLRFDIGLRSKNETSETVILPPSEAAR
jgi:protocatechuate 3,4-dioxygenase alpha subunit